MTIIAPGAEKPLVDRRFHAAEVPQAPAPNWFLQQTGAAAGLS
jgi:hypothetical protein